MIEFEECWAVGRNYKSARYFQNSGLSMSKLSREKQDRCSR